MSATPFLDSYINICLSSCSLIIVMIDPLY
jgi:hypothetical protein